MKRALSVNDLLTMNIPCFEFDGSFYAAFDKPEKTGTWFIWGNSGNGKTRFMLQLSKYMTRFGKVLYDSLEEGASRPMQRAFKETGMNEVAGRILLVKENIEALKIRLRKRKSPEIIIIDSFQYARLNEKKYFDFINEFQDSKLIIFVSQCEGKQPRGSTAVTAMYAASLKIWVEGYRAHSKGRYFGTEPHYTIWEDKAAEYWL